MSKVKKPKFELVGDKTWHVEHQKNVKKIEIQKGKCKTKHVVYIFKCEKSNVLVHGKVNKVSIDKLVGCSVIIETVVSSIEIVGCKNVTVQVKGKAPTITIDNTDGLQLFVQKASFDTDILMSKSSAVNLCPMYNDDYDELALPDQILIKYHHGAKEKITVSKKKN